MRNALNIILAVMTSVAMIGVTANIARSDCYMELRPTGAIADHYLHDSGQYSSSLQMSCQTACDGPTPCPSPTWTSDGVSDYEYCPLCAGGEPTCCHAVVRRYGTITTYYVADVRGPCGMVGQPPVDCGHGSCQLVKHGTKNIYYTGECN